jgi:3-isopropylmalate/(R)-2-methylmalate dehydratase large subunit
MDARRIVPQVTWGTSPEMVTGMRGQVPAPEDFKDPVKREGVARALQYMGLTPRTRSTRSASTRSSSVPAPIRASKICARRRRCRRGRRVADNVKLAMVVPGSGLVRAQAEAEGLDKCSRRPASNGVSRAARCAWR